jgi:hypothetical protein
MTCDEIEELLSDLLDDELADGPRAGVEAHLASCDRCADSYKKLRRTVRFVRANSVANVSPGTPGGLYSDFNRSLVDPDGTARDRILRQNVFRTRDEGGAP